MTTNIEFKVKQREEAITRIKMLKVFPTVVEEFEMENRLNLSEHGMLFWLNKEEEQMVRDWEEETENIVYHVIKSNTNFGLLYSFLYVSKYEEEWEMDRDDLKAGYPLAYVYNVDDEFSSEYGGIGIKPMFGGVVRTA